MHNDLPVHRKPWSLDFDAEPEELSALRRLMRLHLDLWGLTDVIEDAQLCVTELVTNVIAHVGTGTPTTLAVSMNGPHLRIEIHDSDTRVLPTLLQTGVEAEGGRGMALLDAVAVRWGVELHRDRKVTWCELASEPGSPVLTHSSPCLSRAEGLLDLYGKQGAQGGAVAGSHPLSLVRAEEAAISIITDLLHWLHAYGRDPDELLDRAQTHFEAAAGVSS